MYPLHDTTTETTVVNMPECSPLAIEELSPNKFTDILLTQRDRILKCEGNDFLQIIDHNFRFFINSYKRDEAGLRNQVAQNNNNKTFWGRWSPFNSQYEHLVSFVGGLQSVFRRLLQLSLTLES